MSLDLLVLTPADATSFEQALAVVMEEEAGATDRSGQLVAYAQDIYDAYGDDDWPLQGDPIMEASFRPTRSGRCPVGSARP